MQHPSLSLSLLRASLLKSHTQLTPQSYGPLPPPVRARQSVLLQQSRDPPMHVRCSLYLCQTPLSNSPYFREAGATFFLPLSPSVRASVAVVAVIHDENCAAATDVGVVVVAGRSQTK